MTTDELFTATETRAPEKLTSRKEGVWTSDYPDWIVRNVENGFTVTLDLSFRNTSPSEKIQEDTVLYKWLSERLCRILDVSGIIHSNVCFDIENFRSYKSLNAYVFLEMPDSPSLFIRTFYRIFCLGVRVGNRLQAFAKITARVHKVKYDDDGLKVFPDTVYLDRSIEICKFIEWVENYDQLKANLHQLKHYTNYFGLKMPHAGYNSLIYDAVGNQTSYVDEFVADAWTLYATINNELEQFRNLEYVMTREEIDYRFLREPMAVMIWMKHYFKRTARNRGRRLTDAFWKLCKKEMRKRENNELWNYFNTTA